ncbi:MAG: hypothetical protein Q4E36_05190 [Bacillota bacterium]|nr:hypothetical protein [Bacillota bacterium]
MIKLIEVDIKNNKKIFFGLLAFIGLFTLALYLGFYKIRFFNLNENIISLDSQRTNFLKWIEIIFPGIFSIFMIKIFSDSHGKDSLAFSLSLPISNFKFFIGRFCLWTLIFFIFYYPALRFFQAAVIKDLGPEFLPVISLPLYALINMFVLGAYGLFILILFGQYYYSLGFLFAYVLFDYFGQGRFLKGLSLHPLAFKNYTRLEFLQNRLIVLGLALALLAMVYIILEKSSKFRKQL